jgi:hypothetical protein
MCTAVHKASDDDHFAEQQQLKWNLLEML